MSQAAGKNAAFLTVARYCARRWAWVHGTVTADDVRYAAERDEDFPWPTSPNAWGSVFMSPEFEFTGTRVQSAHKANRGRELKVWRLRK